MAFFKKIYQAIENVNQRYEYAAQDMAARWQAVSAEPEAGMATAEYAVVLVAATGFAGLLVAILKSDIVKDLLTSIVQKALSV